MVKLSGKAVYKGVIIGPVAVLKKDDQQVKRTKITDVDAELARLEQAGTQAQEQLQKLYDKAVKDRRFSYDRKEKSRVCGIE